ncbi:MAG TPA: hypothetical protein DCQ50_06015 [Chryseobacterium sp.]|nr:hypothetical protein [Chryseobacterium sp.]
MSAPVQNNFLYGLLGGIEGTFTQPIGGSSQNSSGIVNILNGLNLGGIGGGSPTSSGLSGLLTSVGSSLGPIGAALGFVSNLIPGLDGFLSNGMDFSCLGSQAYNSNDYNNHLNSVKAELQKFDKTTLQGVADCANYLQRVIKEGEIEIGKYRSGCSKNLRRKMNSDCQSILDGIDKSMFETFTETSKTWDNQPYSYTAYRPKAGATATPFSTEITQQQYEQVKLQVQTYASQNGLDYSEAMQQVDSKLFPNGFPSWHINAGSDGSGGVDWEVSAGNKKPNYIGYAILAACAFFGWKVLKK